MKKCVYEVIDWLYWGVFNMLSGSFKTRLAPNRRCVKFAIGKDGGACIFVRKTLMVLPQ